MCIQVNHQLVVAEECFIILYLLFCYSRRIKYIVDKYYV